MNPISKNIRVSITAGATTQDLLAAHQDMKQMLMDGTFSLLATQPSGISDISINVQIGTDFPATNFVPNSSANQPSQLNGDTVINNHVAKMGTPIILQGANSNAANQIISLTLVQQPAILV